MNWKSTRLGGEQNLALASAGAKATASSCLPGYAIHQIAHLNDGQHGNSQSWIAATSTGEWAQIELAGETAVDRVVFSRDRQGQYRDRLAVHFEIRVSLDGAAWQSVSTVKAVAAGVAAPARPPSPQSAGPLDTSDATLTQALEEGDLVRYAFLCEARTCWRVDPTDPAKRVLGQLAQMIDRFEARGIEVDRERSELAALVRRQEQIGADPDAASALFFDARNAKRDLFFRDPDLKPLERILFVHRHPYNPSHNYSVILDAQGPAGGAVCLLEIPVIGGRLEPARARLKRLFEAGQGVARDPVASFDARKIYFAYEETKGDYFHLMVMDAAGSGASRLTGGPFHDTFPCPLPGGGLAFMSTRCRARFLCWRPQAFVLFRMDPGGGNIRPLSHANLSEWTPSLMRDGRILWMRSEYLDKGADFGHTLWAIRPDGAHPELIFGNNTLNCYANGCQVPGTGEICCTLVSPRRRLEWPGGRAIRARAGSTPPPSAASRPTWPRTHMSWANRECFRDPAPVSRDAFLCSHAPDDRFGLYIIDRHGNRELLHLDPTIGRHEPDPVSTGRAASDPAAGPGLAIADRLLAVADVYQGLEPEVRRGAVKYLRVCEEVRADLDPTRRRRLPERPRALSRLVCNADPQGERPRRLAELRGQGHARHRPGGGRRFGKSRTGRQGALLPALDEDFNELQRMRSVVQLQPGETRSCIGCHEDRMSAPPVRQGEALQVRVRLVAASALGSAGPFYSAVVQPVWDAAARAATTSATSADST